MVEEEFETIREYVFEHSGYKWNLKITKTTFFFTEEPPASLYDVRIYVEIGHKFWWGLRNLGLGELDEVEEKYDEVLSKLEELKDMKNVHAVDFFRDNGYTGYFTNEEFEEEYRESVLEAKEYLSKENPEPMSTDDPRFKQTSLDEFSNGD